MSRLPEPAVPMLIDEIPTLALLLDLDVLERNRILPNHSCLTVAQFDEYHAVRGDEVVDRFKVWRGRW